MFLVLINIRLFIIMTLYAVRNAYSGQLISLIYLDVYARVAVETVELRSFLLDDSCSEPISIPTKIKIKMKIIYNFFLKFIVFNCKYRIWANVNKMFPRVSWELPV